MGQWSHIENKTMSVDELKEMFGMNKHSGNGKPNQDKVRDGVSIQVSASDINRDPNCSNCNSSTVKYIGEVNVAGHNHGLYHCQSCYSAFTRQQGGLRGLVEKVADAAGVSTSEVSILTADPGSLTTTVSDAYSTSSHLDLSGQTLNMQNYNLEQEARNQTQEIRNLKYAVNDLVGAIKEVVQQNHRLQEQLATDPLLGLRDKINKFEIT